jgi:outer membrane immunogenic protein
MRRGLGVVAVLLAVAPLAQAADKFYVGASLVRVTDKGDQAPAIYPLAFGVRAGIECNRYSALEVRYASGVKSNSATVSGLMVDLDVDYLYGGYLKGILPLGGASPYVLVGYTHGKETAKVKAFGLSSSAADGGFSFGVGVDVPITKVVWFNAEWARLVKGTDAAGVGFKIEELAIGVAARF